MRAAIRPPTASRAPATARWVWLAVAVWLVAVIAGGAVFLRYQYTPGDPGRAPAQWPADASLSRHPDGSTLVLFAHPHCDCTRASLEELQVILGRQRAALRAYAVFVRLPGMSEAELRDDDGWRQAGRIPGLERRIDAGGTEARRFAALVSGYTVLYGADGRLRFDGGITGSRGHVGANAGRASVLELLRHGESDVARTAVFGCHLFDRAERARRSQGA